jgi:hypothetical protein
MNCLKERVMNLSGKTGTFFDPGIELFIHPCRHLPEPELVSAGHQDQTS